LITPDGNLERAAAAAEAAEVGDGLGAVVGMVVAGFGVGRVPLSIDNAVGAVLVVVVVVVVVILLVSGVVFGADVFQPHFACNSGLRNAIRQPVSLMIFSIICRTSSCASRVTRHSAAIARQRIDVVATPLFLSPVSM
jgi:hypothetical protein